MLVCILGFTLVKGVNVFWGMRMWESGIARDAFVVGAGRIVEVNE